MTIDRNFRQMWRVRFATLTLVGALANAAVCLPATARVSGAAQAPTAFEAKAKAAKSAMMSDPGVALEHARAATRLALRRGAAPTVDYLTARWLEGEALTRLNKPDQARPIVDEALALVVRHTPNTKLHGDLLKSRAALAALNGEFPLALATLHHAFELYARLGEARSQAIVLQNIGSIYSEARDYPKVLSYYDQANEVFKGDHSLTISAHNNRGNAFKELGRLAEAEQEYRLALKIATPLNSPLLEARIKTNIASAQMLRGNLRSADLTAVSALQQATKDATEWRPFLWGVRAQVAFARADLASALEMIERTFIGVDLATTTMLYRDFHDSARQIYAAAGRDREALAHLTAFKRLDDEARSVSASANAALLAARFDATNQDLRIARLKAGQMARDLKLATSEQRFRLFIWVGAIGALAASAIIGAILFALASARRSRRQVTGANAQLTYAARHDGLTELPNRAYLRMQLDTAITAGPCSLFLVDLDRFKAVNDTLGHQAGDRLLCAVSQRLKATCDGDRIVGRLGGDEFAIIWRGAHSDDALIEFAQRIIADLCEPTSIDGAHVTIGATIGIAAGPQDATTVDGLIRGADLALYRAKEAGRGRAVRYERFMQEAAETRRQLEHDLRSALSKGQMEIAYQPIVRAGDAKIVAYEALLRWTHPTLGPIAPSVFIPIAEESKLINAIGAWVLRSACAEAMNWPEDVRLAINISAIQVEGEALASTVVNALATCGLSPSRLELEVTESVFLRQGVQTETTLESLRSLGVTLALDDFGTGFSSLGYLQRAAFSTIKIDRSFVHSAAAGSQDGISIIRAIVALADGLGMETTAEGVETKAQLEVMRSLRCSHIQGYLFGRPMTSQSSRTGTVRNAA